MGVGAACSRSSPAHSGPAQLQSAVHYLHWTTFAAVYASRMAWQISILLQNKLSPNLATSIHYLSWFLRVRNPGIAQLERSGSGVSHEVAVKRQPALYSPRGLPRHAVGQGFSSDSSFAPPRISGDVCRDFWMSRPDVEARDAAKQHPTICKQPPTLKNYLSPKCQHC